YKIPPFFVYLSTPPEGSGQPSGSFRDSMTPEEVARYDSCWDDIGNQKALEARDNLIKNTPGANKKATAIGAYDIENGNVTAGFAGPIPDNINPQLMDKSNEIGGIGSKGVNGKNTVGVCAEFQTANELLNMGGDISNIRFTEAIRPRTGTVIPTCTNCLEMFFR
ncbi:hypothetical protein, partial [Lacrimispora sp.]|uniref:hypothetical protein n=1 Tax=Lacrimispora sp. TaxID=2719234 RepID=UPI0028A5CE19